ncbi:MAG: universal stress protein [Actinomycetota bacterium]|nr:universal stress protein [Actinomycetota bacterium]
MTPYRRIVVGTDGSDSARRAVEHAAWLAERLGSELVISHAYQEVPEERGAARQVGASLLRDAAAELGEVTPVLREGDAAETLLTLGAEEGPSLLVVGNRGLGRRRVVLGNVPGKVAHRAPTDVLIAHSTGPAGAPRYGRMLLATDGSPTAERAVAAGRALSEALGMEASDLRVTVGDPAAGIVAAAQERGVDLIVMGNRGMMGARRFVASVPSKVLRHAPCHVLLVKTT